ncbi:MAG: hypothetical protein V4536_08560 [Pseudomonadota bacterium]
MTDKELLALAAKAAWIDYVIHNELFLVDIDEMGHTVWNPLIDDVDAFRLAVKLQLEVYHANDEGDAVYVGYYLPENTGMKYCIEYYDDINHLGLANSATRRAIVRAAAEIGKTL